jgi:hypothetical protein
MPAHAAAQKVPFHSWRAHCAYCVRFTHCAKLFHLLAHNVREMHIILFMGNIHYWKHFTAWGLFYKLASRRIIFVWLKLDFSVYVLNSCCKCMHMPSVRDGWMVGRLLDVLLINHRTTAHNALHCWGLCLPRPVSAPAIFYIVLWLFTPAIFPGAAGGTDETHTQFCHQVRRKYLCVEIRQWQISIPFIFKIRITFFNGKYLINF